MPGSYPGVECYERSLTAAEIRRLAEVLEGEMPREGAGRPAPFPATEEYAGRFYPGREFYIFWQNCNAWTLRTLRDAGLGGDPSLVVFAPQIGGGLDPEAWMPPGRPDE